MNYKEVIGARYDREAWQWLLRDIFRDRVRFWSAPTPAKVSGRLAREALSLGKISLADGESIAIYEVELGGKVGIGRDRRCIRDMLTKDWGDMGHAGAFMLCHRKDEGALEFSYVSGTWGQGGQGGRERTSTGTRCHTYLLGEGRGCRTAMERLGALKNGRQALSDITDAFSVETLTRRFYKDLFGWYQWAMEPSSNVSFPGNAGDGDDARDSLETKMILLITNVMFAWFVKQKGLVPSRIFDVDYLSATLKDFDPYSHTVGNYYDAILRNLFFAALNRAVEDGQGNRREFAGDTGKDDKTPYHHAGMFSVSEDDVVALFSEVPSLNAGLLERLDNANMIGGVGRAGDHDGHGRDGKRPADGRRKHRAVVPNNLFFEPEKGLISILSRYDFTAEENSPGEQQVALDPELLGKVFENLLGAYNTETRETARNKSGSFYTPREIVNYMVDESLIAYLGESGFNRSLFDPNFKFEAVHASEYKAVAEKLKAVKVLDPACGSGAFPMGLLNRMVEVLRRIEPDTNVYEQKLAIIENCLYGSDIQSIAVQITKLRFFISLICDCEKDASKPNLGMPTLPNLETRFIAANSLIPKKERSSCCLFENPEIEPTKVELAKVRHENFMAKSASAKRRLREKDRELREKLASLLEGDKDFAPEDAMQLAAWDPYDQNAASPFLDPEWMFGVAGGFDIVIGNPPYIQLQNNSGELAKLYERRGYSTFARTGDIYCLFYERGWQLLKQGGHLCYITSNKWMRASYGEKTRGFLANSTNPKLLIDFAGVKIFESATVDTNILLFSKSANRHKTWCAVTNKQNKDGVRNLSDFVRRQGCICDFSSSDSWVMLSPIERSIKRKIEAVGVPLKDWDVQINSGIKTGCDDAFIISTEKRNEILANCKDADERKRTEELIRPILRGRDMKRYGYDWANLWLINTHNGIKGKLPRIQIEDYPAIKQWLDNGGITYNGKKYNGFGQIKNRADQGDTPYNLRNCAYMEDFLKEKILYSEIVQEPRFYLDKKEHFFPAETTFILTGQHLGYLTDFLNSDIIAYFFKRFYSSGLGENGYRYKKKFLNNLPVPKPRNLDMNIDKNYLYSTYDFSREEMRFINSLFD